MKNRERFYCALHRGLGIKEAARTKARDKRRQEEADRLAAAVRRGLPD